jgi:hypothetical protein
MVSGPASQPDGGEAPSPRKGTRRRPRGREPVVLYWAVFAVLLMAAFSLNSWRVGLFALMLWCFYEFLVVPTVCRVSLREGYTCNKPVRGRPLACTPAHQQVKTDALWRLAGLRNPLRKKPVRDPNRETGTMVYSPKFRGRLAQADRTLILLASAGTLVTIAGLLYGFGEG